MSDSDEARGAEWEDPDAPPRREPAPDGRRPVTPLGPIRIVGGHSARYHPPRRCPPGAPCDSDDLIASHPVIAAGQYRADELNHGEAAALMQSIAEAEVELNTARPGLDAATGDLSAARIAVVAARTQLDAFVRSDRLHDALAAVKAVQRRHAHDGPESRLYRPRWVKWGLPLAIGAAAVYDTTFFAEVFATLIDAPGTAGDIRTYIGLLPGIMIAAALLTAGHWLAQSVTRSRAHRERRTTRRRWFRREPQQRDHEAMPFPLWGLAWGFTALVVAVMGLWAFIRGGGGTPTAAAYAALLLLFTIAAIAVEVVYHNPYLDTQTAADARLAAAKEEAKGLVDACGAAMGRYAKIASALATGTDAAESTARQRVLRAWTQILKDRDAHGRAGDVAPRVADRSGERTAPGPKTQPMFERIAEPLLWLGAIREARATLQSHDVDEERRRCEAAIEGVAEQEGPSPGTETAMEWGGP